LRGLYFSSALALAPALARQPGAAGRVVIRNAERVVAMDEKTAQALRRGKGASQWHAVEAVREGEAACAVSAGNTGALMAISRLILRMIADLDRPALVAGMPTPKGVTTFLDVGANVDCDAERLVEFAIMGEAFHCAVHGSKRPTVGLLNVGSEDQKGHEEVREAHRILKASMSSFIGNVEARDVYRGQADVIVCDGFTGNVALKISEGLVELFEGRLSPELSVMTDYSEYGGAPLLGVNGVAIVGHGRSSAKAIRSGVAMAHRFASARLIERIEGDIASSAVPHR